eukprot:TRINITY_DN27456_c0_g1_i1.p6 TRINITY_DN27456_c0_g1~~TRINITY_DN27456_c0_g1_i1.p6  ORF type:complete len:136 (+),score=2.37 TRINITY_DN27456_c0_g1_i1:1865-2272(+)
MYMLTKLFCCQHVHLYIVVKIKDATSEQGFQNQSIAKNDSATSPNLTSSLIKQQKILVENNQLIKNFGNFFKINNYLYFKCVLIDVSKRYMNAWEPTVKFDPSRITWEYFFGLLNQEIVIYVQNNVRKLFESMTG